MTTPVRQAVVLAGGFGTRLGHLTETTPKPLLPVGGRPFLDWVVGNLGAQGVERVIVTVGYRAEAFESWKREATGPAVRTFVEPAPLGTGGALPLLADELDETFLVLNGDTLFDAPLQALAGLREATGMAGAIALRSVPDVARYGAVGLDDSRISSFAEKGEAGPGLINGGVYVFSREALEYMRTPCSIEEDALPGLVGEGKLAGLPCDGFFIDIGVPSSFEEAQSSVPAWWAEARG